MRATRMVLGPVNKHDSVAQRHCQSAVAEPGRGMENNSNHAPETSIQHCAANPVLDANRPENNG